MKALVKTLRRIVTVIFILTLLTPVALVGCAYGYVRYEMRETGMSYTDTVEKIIVDMVPDEGIVVYGKYYGPSKMYSFLEEVRYDPENYIHKDHHCILQDVPQEYIRAVVTSFRIILLGKFF